MSFMYIEGPYVMAKVFQIYMFRYHYYNSQKYAILLVKKWFSIFVNKGDWTARVYTTGPPPWLDTRHNQHPTRRGREPLLAQQ